MAVSLLKGNLDTDRNMQMEGYLKTQGISLEDILANTQFDAVISHFSSYSPLVLILSHKILFFSLNDLWEGEVE